MTWNVLTPFSQVPKVLRVPYSFLTLSTPNSKLFPCTHPLLIPLSAEAKRGNVPDRQIFKPHIYFSREGVGGVSSCDSEGG